MKNREKAAAARQGLSLTPAHPDMMRQQVVDELSTIAIWTAMAGFCLEVTHSLPIYLSFYLSIYLSIYLSMYFIYR